MVHALVKRQPIADRADFIEKLDKEAEQGTIDLARIMRKEIDVREFERRNGAIAKGLMISVLGAGVTLAFLPELIIGGAVFGAVLWATGYSAVNRYEKVKTDLRKGQLAPHMTDEELSELEGLWGHLGDAATPQLAESRQKLLSSILDEVEEWAPTGPNIKPLKDASVPDGAMTELAPTALVEAGDSTLPAMNLPLLTQAPLSLLWGGQGSGKTTTANYLIYEAVERDYQVVVADPHYAAGDWPGLPVYGKAMSFDECDLLLSTVLGLCDARYQERAEKGTQPYQFEQVLVVLEEFTDWSSQCQNTQEFITAACQQFRKVGIHVLIISHAQTLIATGNAKGMSEAFHKGSIKLELVAEMKEVRVNDVVEMRPRPKGVGHLFALGTDKGLHKISDLSNWKIPTVQAKDFPLGGAENGATKSPPAAPPDINQGHESTARNKSRSRSIEGTGMTRGDARKKIANWVRNAEGKQMTYASVLRKFQGKKDKNNDEPSQREHIKPILPDLIEEVARMCPEHFKVVSGSDSKPFIKYVR